MEIGKDQDMLVEQLKALQQSFNEYREKSEKGAKTIQVLQKDLKLAKTARKKQKIQLAYTQIVSKQTQANHKELTLILVVAP